MLNKINYSSNYKHSTFSNLQQVLYDTKEKRVLLCDSKEENMDSTDSALDEIVSSFLHECLSVCTRFSISVGYFSLIK